MRALQILLSILVLTFFAHANDVETVELRAVEPWYPIEMTPRIETGYCWIVEESEGKSSNDDQLSARRVSVATWPNDIVKYEKRCRPGSTWASKLFNFQLTQLSSEPNFQSTLTCAGINDILTKSVIVPYRSWDKASCPLFANKAIKVNFPDGEYVIVIESCPGAIIVCPDGGAVFLIDCPVKIPDYFLFETYEHCDCSQ